MVSLKALTVQNDVALWTFSFYSLWSFILLTYYTLEKLKEDQIDSKSQNATEISLKCRTVSHFLSVTYVFGLIIGIV